MQIAPLLPARFILHFRHLHTDDPNQQYTSKKPKSTFEYRKIGSEGSWQKWVNHKMSRIWWQIAYEILKLKSRFARENINIKQYLVEELILGVLIDNFVNDT